MLLSCYEFQLILRHFWNESNTACDLRFWSRFADAPNVTCVQSNRFCVLLSIILSNLLIRQTQPVCGQMVSNSRDRWRFRWCPTPSRILSDRQTLRVCSQIASGRRNRLCRTFSLFAKRYVGASSAFPEVDLWDNSWELLFSDPLNATKRSPRNGFCVFIPLLQNVIKTYEIFIFSLLKVPNWACPDAKHAWA